MRARGGKQHAPLRETFTTYVEGIVGIGAVGAILQGVVGCFCQFLTAFVFLAVAHASRLQRHDKRLVIRFVEVWA